MRATHSVAKSFAQRIGIFVDVQNMFYSAKILHQSKLDYGRLIREITGDRYLVRAVAYIVHKPDVDQAGFHDALMRFGYELRIKELKIRQDPDGQGRGTAKGDWNVGLTVDVMSLAPKLDTIALVTGDGDYVPLAEALKAHGCRVEVYGFERATASELAQAADQYVPIREDWIFKEKKFEKEPEEVNGGQPGGQYVGSTAPGEIDKNALPVDDEDAQPVDGFGIFGVAKK
jgi:uncharacterized LabA/DUF88 family protein